jgi:hypothetical protein
MGIEDRARMMNLIGPDGYEVGFAEGLCDEDLLDIVERFVPQHDAALALAAEKGIENLTFDELLAASSLGTPMALYLRSLCPPEVVEAVRAHGRPDDSD